MKPWSVEECESYAKQLRNKTRANTAEHAAQAIEYLLGLLKREWVGLTEEEVEAIGKDDKVLLAQFHTSVKAIDQMKDPTAQIMKLVIRQQAFNFAKAIEAALREKNGG